MRVAKAPHFLEIRAEGYGENEAEDGKGSPILIEVHEGKLRILAYPDINSVEPTIIEMEGARETEREEKEKEDE